MVAAAEHELLDEDPVELLPGNDELPMGDGKPAPGMIEEIPPDDVDEVEDGSPPPELVDAPWKFHNVLKISKFIAPEKSTATSVLPGAVLIIMNIAFEVLPSGFTLIVMISGVTVTIEVLPVLPDKLIVLSPVKVSVLPIQFKIISSPTGAIFMEGARFNVPPLPRRHSIFDPSSANARLFWDARTKKKTKPVNNIIKFFFFIV